MIYDRDQKTYHVNIKRIEHFFDIRYDVEIIFVIFEIQFVNRDDNDIDRKKYELHAHSLISYHH